MNAFRTPGLFAALALAVLASSAATDDKDLHPIAAKVKSELKDPAKPFTMTVNLQVRDGAAERFEAAFAKALRATRKEKGCVAYDLNRNAKDTSRYIVYERWKSLADLESHLRSDHITTLLGELKDLLAGEPDVSVLLPAAE